MFKDGLLAGAGIPSCEHYLREGEDLAESLEQSFMTGPIDS